MSTADSRPFPAAGSTLVLATSNRHKLIELRRLLASLSVDLRPLDDWPEFEPVEETATTIRGNAILKARYTARSTGQWALADDTGLEVAALQGAPGVRSARFAGEHASMAENRQLLLDRLAAVPLDQRQARFVCCLALCNSRGELVTHVEGECAGLIRSTESGDAGFGYDRLFEVAGTGRTLAELSDAETDQLGHRGRAVRQLLTFLDSNSTDTTVIKATIREPDHDDN